MNDKVIKYMEQARAIAANDKLPPDYRARYLYRLAGHAEGYGTAMLDRDANVDYAPGVGSACCQAARRIQEIAEKLLGYEKP